MRPEAVLVVEAVGSKTLSILVVADAVPIVANAVVVAVREEHLGWSGTVRFSSSPFETGVWGRW